VFEQFYCILRRIINYIPIKKLSTVKFWSDFVSLAAKMGGECLHYMWKIAGSSDNFLLDDDFIAKIFTFFD
jgi:hypothetical protein